MGRELKAGKGSRANTLKSANNESRFILIADRGINNHWDITPNEMNKTYIVVHTSGWDARLQNTAGFQIGDWVRIFKHSDSSSNITMELDNSYSPGAWNGETVVFVGTGNGVGGSSWEYFSRSANTFG